MLNISRNPNSSSSSNNASSLITPGHKRENYRGEEIDAIFEWLEKDNNFFEFYYNGKKSLTSDLSQHMEEKFGKNYSEESLKHKLHNLKALYRWIEKYFVLNAGSALDNDSPEDIVAKKERKMRGYVKFHKLEADFRQNMYAGAILPGKYIKSNGFTAIQLKQEAAANSSSASSRGPTNGELADDWSSNYSRTESPLEYHTHKHNSSNKKRKRKQIEELEQKTIEIKERKLEIAEKRLKELEKWEPIIQTLREQLYEKLGRSNSKNIEEGVSPKEPSFPIIPDNYIQLLKVVQSIYSV